MTKLNNLTKRSLLKGWDYRKSFIVKILYLFMYSLKRLNGILDEYLERNISENQTPNPIISSNPINEHIKFKIDLRTGKMETIIKKIF